MKQRRLLTSKLIAAWRKCIKGDYCSQRINSERSLQASFWAQLNRTLGKDRRLFIEPILKIKTKQGRIRRVVPDLVICNSKEVIGVIELKYLPRGRANYQKDVKTLSLIAQNRAQLAIANERFRGREVDSKRYVLSRHVLFVWAGIHAKPSLENQGQYSYGNASLNKCYLQMQAITAINSDPKIIIEKW